MSENSMFRHGAFGWCELMTTDVEAAKRFYTELLGWTTEEVPNMSYTIVKTGGTGIGGIMAIPPQAAGTPPWWGTYVTVESGYLHHYLSYGGNHRVRCRRGTGSPCPPHWRAC